MFHSPDSPGAADPSPGAVEPVTNGAVAGAGSRPETSSWADRHPLAVLLDSMSPGPGLVDVLAGLDPADVDDPALLEAVAGWERVIAWSHAQQTTLVAEMLRRGGASRAAEFTADEIAARLATTRRAAQTTVDLAVRLEQSPPVHHALSTGRLDRRKAAVLTQDTAHLGLAVGQTIQAAVLPDAPGLTVPQLRAALRRAELSVDPTAAQTRHERAVADRSVRLTPAPCSMAWLSAYLPADHALRIMTTLDALATTTPPGDTRRIDARRADALVDVMSTVLDTGIGPHGPLPERQRRRPHLDVTASASSLLGLDQAPAHLTGYGAIPATMARRIAAQATWKPVLIDAHNGTALARATRTYRPDTTLVNDVTRRDVTCTFPGCRTPATGCDLDHIIRFDKTRPADQQTLHTNLHTLCRHHHRLKTSGRWQVQRDPTSGTTTWTAPTGHTYTRDPVPTDPTMIGPPTAPPDNEPGEVERTTNDATRPARADPEPPPF